jgi:hypothetical protein
MQMWRCSSRRGASAHDGASSSLTHQIAYVGPEVGWLLSTYIVEEGRRW